MGERCPKLVAAEPGFEPGPKDPKSRVLPLHHSAALRLVAGYYSTLA